MSLSPFSLAFILKITIALFLCTNERETLTRFLPAKYAFHEFRGPRVFVGYLHVFNTKSVIPDKQPVISSAKPKYQAANIVPPTTLEITRTTTNVVGPGDGFFPDMIRESVNSSAKKEEQISTKLRSLNLRNLWVEKCSVVPEIAPCEVFSPTSVEKSLLSSKACLIIPKAAPNIHKASAICCSKSFMCS